MARPPELPIPDFDSAPLGALAPRLRSLDREQIEMLLEHERAHADRPAYVLHLEQRLAELDAGATPTSGASGQPASPPTEPAQGGSPVSPQTSGPPINPPTGGDPTNPAQPRT